MTVSQEMRDMDQDLEEVRLIAYQQGWIDGFEKCRRLAREEGGEATPQQQENPATSWPSQEGPAAKRTRARGRTGRPGLQGEKHPNAKLKEQDVIDIRTSSERPRALAERYGVKISTIYNIRSRVTWKHIPEETIAAALREIEQAGVESPMLPTRPANDDCSLSIDLTAPQP